MDKVRNAVCGSAVMQFVLWFTLVLALLAVFPATSAQAFEDETECERCERTGHPGPCMNCLIELWWDHWEYEPLWGDGWY